eukprot:Seg922.4 transcript_id=Seg922.4/GoldUCD/mRNA.D3Y31 product="Cholecystokinin receptor" protein_id=Seg922.4/GoldUCD/D3Y31
MWISVAVPVAIFVLFTNLIVIALIYRSRKLQTLRNVPLIGLATADLLVGALWIPLATASTYVPDNKILCRAALYFEILTMHASLFNLIAVSAERWIAIFRPLHYYQIATKSRVVASLAASWVLSFILLFAFLIADKYDNGVTKCDIVKYANIWFLFLISCIFYMVCGIMIIMQLKVYIIVRNQLRKIRPVSVQPNVPRGLIAATSFIVEESVNVIETADDKDAKTVDQRRSNQSLNTVSRLGCREPIKECPGAFSSPKGVTECAGTLQSQTGANKCMGALSSTNGLIFDTTHFPLNSNTHRRLEPIITNIDGTPKVENHFRDDFAKKSSMNRNALSRAQTESKLDWRIVGKTRRTSAGLGNKLNNKSNMDQSKSNKSNVKSECSGANKVVEPIEDVAIARNKFKNKGTRKISKRGVKNRAMLYSKCEKTTGADVKSSIKSIDFCNIVNLQQEDMVENEPSPDTILQAAKLWRIRAQGKQHGVEKQWINSEEISRAKSNERGDDSNSDNGYQSISDERPSLADIFTASSLKKGTSIQPIDKATAKRVACYSIDKRGKNPLRKPKQSILAIARVLTTIKKQRRKEFARSIAVNLVCLCFVVMWAPKSTVDMLTGLGYCQRCSLAHSISAVLAWTNSGINALIYAWRMPEFREAIFACKISRIFNFMN